MKTTQLLNSFQVEELENRLEFREWKVGGSWTYEKGPNKLHVEAETTLGKK